MAVPLGVGLLRRSVRTAKVTLVPLPQLALSAVCLLLGNRSMALSDNQSFSCASLLFLLDRSIPPFTAFDFRVT